MLKIFPNRNDISHLWPCISQASSTVTQLFSSVRPHTLKDTSTFPRGCSAIPNPWHFWRDLNTSCWETTLVSAAPQPEPLHNRCLTIPIPTDPLFLPLPKVISPLSRRKWTEEQKPELVHYSQLHNLPLSKTLSVQTPLSCVHPPKRHSDLLAHFKETWQHVSVS